MNWLFYVVASNAVVAALLAVGVFLFSRLCRRPALIHCLWVVVLVKLVTPPFVEAPLPGWWSAAPVDSVEVEDAAANPPRTDMTVARVHWPVDMPVEFGEPSESSAEFVLRDDLEALSGPTIEFAPGAIALDPEQSVVSAGDEVIADVRQPDDATGLSPNSENRTAASPSFWTTRTAMYVLFGLWLAGAVFVCSLIALRVWRFQRFLRQALPAPRGLQKEVARLAERMGLSRPPRVVLIRGTVSPMLWSWGGASRILFPLELAGQLDRRSRETLLVHELAHFRRGDHLVRLLELAASVLYWWNPVVWWARREIHLAEEDCCDAWVVSQLPDQRPTYARALLATIDFLSDAQPALPPAASGIGYFNTVQQRLKRIMTGTASRNLSGMGKLAVTTLAIVMLPLLPTLRGQEPPAAETVKNEQPSSTADEGDSGSTAAAATFPEPTEFENRPQSLQAEPAPLRCVTVSPSGDFLATGNGDHEKSGELVVWDVKTRSVRFSRKYSLGVRCVAVSPNGKLIAAGNFDHTAQLIDAASGEVRAVLKGHSGGVNSIAFSPDGKSLASGGLDRMVILWDVTPSKTGAAMNLSPQKTLAGHTNWVFSVAFSPDGKLLASCGRDRTVRIWDVVSGEMRSLTNAQSEGECVVFSPDGGILAACDWNGTVKLFDVSTGKELATLAHTQGVANGKVTCAAFSHDGKTLFTSGFDGTVKAWDVASGQVRATVQAHAAWVWSMVVFADGKRLATASEDHTVKLWNLDPLLKPNPITLARQTEAAGTPQPVLSVAVSPAGTMIAAAHEDKTVRLLDAKSGAVIRVLTGHEDVVASLAFAPDGKSLASASYDGTVKIWELNSDAAPRVRTLKGHTNWVFGVAFSPDGKTLATASYDKTIRLWNVARGESLAVLKGHTAAVRTVAFSPDGKLLASGSGDRAVKIWDLSSLKEIVVLKRHQGAVRAVAFSPDGETLATASEDKTIHLWDVERIREAEPRATLSGHRAMVWALAFSPRGGTLASGGLDNVIKLWDPASGAERATLRGHQDVVTSLAFSPDASALVSGSYDKSLKVWKSKGPPVPAVAPLVTIPGPANTRMSAALSPDGKWLASAGKEKTLQLRDLRTGRVVKQLSLARSGASHVEFSPSGRHLAAALFNGEINVWDLEQSDAPAEFRDHKEGARRVRFSPDGRLLASVSFDRTFKLWDIEQRKLLFTSPQQPLAISDVAFSPDGKTLATCTGNWRTWQNPGEIKLWDVASRREIAVLGKHSVEIKGIGFTPNGERLMSYGPGGVQVWNVAKRLLEKRLAERNSLTGMVLLDGGNKIVTGDTSGKITVWDVGSGRALLQCAGHNDNIFSLAASADSSLLASVARDGALKLWPTSAAGQVRQISADRYLFSLAFSPDGRRALTGGPASLRLWDVKTGRAVREYKGQSGKVTGVDFTPDGRRVLSSSSDRTVRVWDTASGQELLRLEGHIDDVRCVAVSPDGRRALSGGIDKQMILWDVETGRELRRFTGHKYPIWAVAFSPDGRLAACGASGAASLWEVKTGTLKHICDTDSLVSSVAFTPDGGTLLTAQADQQLAMWDVKSGQLIRKLSGHSNRLQSVCVTRDGRFALTGGYDGAIIQWDLKNEKAPPYRLGAHVGGASVRINRLALTPDEKLVVSAGSDGTLRFWDRTRAGETIAARVRAWRPASASPTARLELRHTIKAHDKVWFVAYSPDGKWVATGGADKTSCWKLFYADSLSPAELRGGAGFAMHGAFSPDSRLLAVGTGGIVKIWDLQQAKAVRTLSAHTKGIRAIQFSPDGRTLATCSDDATLIAWDAASGKKRFVVRSDLPFYSLAYSPDGRMLAAGGGDWRERKKTEVKIWDAANGKQLKTLPGSKELINGLAFSPDGRLLAARSESGPVGLWDVASGNRLRQFGLLRGTRPLAFSPDGNWLAAGSGYDSGYLKLVQAADGKLAAQADAHDSMVFSLDFSPDGKTLASASADGTVKFWSMEKREGKE